MTHKFHPGTDFQTADGRKVEIYKVTDEYIHGRIGDNNHCTTWSPRGKLGQFGMHLCGDLIPAPRNVTLQGFYVTYYADGSRCSTTNSESYAKNEKPEGGYIRHIPAEEREVE